LFNPLYEWDLSEAKSKGRGSSRQGALCCDKRFTPAGRSIMRI
jgi:hypothetical protein